ncbi:serine/threonine-protein kinase mTOR-like [Petromyzon marinus]|uniref:serine/threonine-protein kinase mTOR-like n=1 Tax=Petromyzon marinus TaxID=7757 RepID=UPI003F6F738A
MFTVLEPLHSMMERGPQTLKETSFNQAYGRDLMEAQDWCRKFMRSGNQKDLTQAWDLYYHVFRRISKQLPQLTSLELQYVSPKLLMCRDLELAVPGTYDPNQAVVRIESIASALQVITSKQRPRKLTIMGSNGHEFMFLLKGHEDLRQDERVMQLFGLVNTLLANDPASMRKNLSIQRYAVIPLSTNSGLIGWVPHCDSLCVSLSLSVSLCLSLSHSLSLPLSVSLSVSLSHSASLCVSLSHSLSHSLATL